MTDDKHASIAGRQSERVETDRKVTIRIGDHVLVGNGQNISDQGVFFVAEGRLPVQVEIAGRDGVLTESWSAPRTWAPDRSGSRFASTRRIRTSSTTRRPESDTVSA